MDDDNGSGLASQVRAQLAGWGLDGTAEGAAALDIARRLEGPRVAPSAAALLHGQLRALLADLRKMAPEETVHDDIADLQDEYEGLKAVPDL